MIGETFSDGPALHSGDRVLEPAPGLSDALIEKYDEYISHASKREYCTEAGEN